MKIVFFCFLFILSALSFAQPHPLLLFNSDEVELIRSQVNQYGLFTTSFVEEKSNIDQILFKPIELPPPGEAGGYSHERHKRNYREMKQAGELFVLTGDEKYARFVRDMLLKYAEFYPSLGPHPLSHKQAPGRIFHQMLNENVWLLHASVAFDCVFDWLSEDDRNVIIKNVFRNMTDWMINERGDQLDRIHNHGVWAVAALGMTGYVLGDQNLVDIALYGTAKDGKSGFLKQLDLLLSPDGYYTEGPYYIRYALRPFFYFAEAIERNQPEIKIFDYRDQILKKTLYTTMQTMLPNGAFPSINDASRTMGVSSPGSLFATDICYYRYGADPNLLGLASIQNRVELNIAGLKIAEDFEKNPNQKVKWNSIEFRDGPDGAQGGLGILRNQNFENQSYVLMKYGTHGGGHGHFDQLGLLYFHNHGQVLTDYGYARWINIEPKYGGRYLPENKSYAEQTIAHNTVTVDMESQNRGKSRQADKTFGQRHFFNSDDPSVQALSAVAKDCYPGVEMQRTIFLIGDPDLSEPLLVDLYIVFSEDQHQYDYAVHYTGQLMATSFKYNANEEALHPLGKKFGYQHIWVTAGGKPNEGSRIIWLDGSQYYTLISNTAQESEVYFGTIGAHDPSFNLRAEPMFIIREEKKNHIFASVIEPHGFFDESREISINPYGRVSTIKVLAFEPDEGVVAEISFKNGQKWTIMVETYQASGKDVHRIHSAQKSWSWKNQFKIEKINK